MPETFTRAAGRITLTPDQWDTALTLAEAAPLLDRQPNTLRHHALAGHLRTVQIARRHFTTMRWLTEFLADTNTDPPAWWPAAPLPPTTGDRIILPVPPAAPPAARIPADAHTNRKGA
jgi:hypothetical protein